MAFDNAWLLNEWKGITMATATPTTDARVDIIARLLQNEHALFEQRNRYEITALRLAHKIRDFQRDCDEAEHTDVCDANELLAGIREQLMACYCNDTQTKPDVKTKETWSECWVVTTPHEPGAGDDTMMVCKTEAIANRIADDLTHEKITEIYRDFGHTISESQAAETLQDEWDWSVTISRCPLIVEEHTT